MTMRRRRRRRRREPWAPAGLARRVGGSPLALRLGGAVVLAVLVWRLGTGRSRTPWVPSTRGRWRLAVVIAALTTRVLRLALDAGGRAVSASTCRCGRRRGVLPLAVPQHARRPGGVLGDVHRGVRHGASVGDVGRGLRAVAWERGGGQVVQVVLAVACCPCSRHRRAVADACGLVRGRRRRPRWPRRVGGRPCRGTARTSPRAGRVDRDGRSWTDVRVGLLAGRWAARSCSPRRVVVAGHIARSWSPRAPPASTGSRSHGCCRWPCSSCWRWRCR